jgi:hypothetical protein
MSEASVPLDRLELDQLGRVILPDTLVDVLIEAKELSIAGANPSYCVGSSNGSCTNSGSCMGTTNYASCSNPVNCSSSNNPMHCA